LAVRELAIQMGFSNEDHRRFSEWAETIGPSRGSKVVAKAWTDGGPTTHANWFKSHNDIRPCGVDSAEAAPLIAPPPQPGPER
jgi:hypothetical protein